MPSLLEILYTTENRWKSSWNPRKIPVRVFILKKLQQKSLQFYKNLSPSQMFFKELSLFWRPLRRRSTCCQFAIWKLNIKKICVLWKWFLSFWHVILFLLLRDNKNILHNVQNKKLVMHKKQFCVGKKIWRCTKSDLVSTKTIWCCTKNCFVSTKTRMLQ